ncbi:MAG TPA: hypothetical protein PLP33_07250 [Leptospiraceae bacterium]|nr:hypothetical protein [Leptospiraceae bacterium]
MNKTIKVFHYYEIPKNFTGIVEYPNGSFFWYKEGNLHRIDGPAAEYPDGSKFWYIENNIYPSYELLFLFQTSIYLGKKQNGNHNLDWLRFLTDQGIKEFPIIPGMEQDNNFKLLFNQVFGATIK